MWIPDWLYERLPHVYIAAGLCCLWFLAPSPPAVLSGVLLCGAALLTHLRRQQARRPPPAKGARRSR